MSKSDPVEISIPKPDIRTVEIPLIGDSRLVMHRWSEKAKQLILDRQMGKARGKKEAKDPQADYEATIYKSVDGWVGFPATAFKASAVGACRYVEGITMVMARGTIFVESDGETEDGIELVRILGDEPRMREDAVKIGMGVADIRHRAETKEWHADIRVRYNANIISAEQLINLFNLAGHHVGIGEGRPGAPKSTMDWGMFHVATGEEAAT